MAKHLPVMVDDCVRLLNLKDGAVIVDATLGLGGHTEAILEAANVRVIGIDRDENAIRLASERLARFGQRFSALHTTYDNIAQAVELAGPLDGILMDLGVSSMQLDEDDRGFAYSRKAPLDMRMDTSRGQTAAQLLASLDQREIERILKRYGQEPSAARIARGIVAYREKQPLVDSAQLNEIIDQAVPAPARRRGGHPAKRTFQALRIAVNDELSVLERALPAALESLKVGGRLVVESYHSLEDRLVKQAFAKVTTDHTPLDLPVTAEWAKADYKLITRGALQASEAEIANNPRATSVRLRAIERIR